MCNAVKREGKKKTRLKINKNSVVQKYQKKNNNNKSSKKKYCTVTEGYNTNRTFYKISHKRRSAEEQSSGRKRKKIKNSQSIIP